MSAGKAARLQLLDILRGLCLLSMILYHGMYDLVHMLGVSAPWFHGWQGHLWQQSVCWTFILLSGFCWGFSRRPVRRGLFLIGCGWLITAVTYLVLPSELILYGVLHLLGLSPLLLALLHALSSRAPKALRGKCPPWLGLLLCALLFFITREIPFGFLGFEDLRICPLPGRLYPEGALGWFTAALGFPPSGFSSSDYFPLIPWFFLFAAGHFLRLALARFPKAFRLLEGPTPCPVPLIPLRWAGAHSLWVYLLHQPLLFGAVSLAQMLSA